MKTNDARQTRPRGQILVIFAGAVFMLMMLTALVVDVSWYWVNSLRIQRAADAAALAGAVLLPSDRPNAYDRAIKEATKNGYTRTTDTSGNCVICVTPLTVNATPRRLSVTITAPVGMFFMRVAGITSIPATRVGRAEFTLPVPMGSPENYYGVFGLTRGLTTTSTSTQTVQTVSFPQRETDWENAALATPTSSSTGWQSSLGSTTNTNLVNAINSDNSSYAYTAVQNRQQQWGNFGFQFPLQNSGGVAETFNAVEGIEVFLGDVTRTAGFGCTSGNGVRVRVDLSWNGGTSWSGFDETGTISSSGTDNETLGDNNSLNPWSGHTWAQADFSDANFRVRWTAIKPNGCGAEIRVDEMEVRIYYEVRRVTTTQQTVTTTNPVTDENLRGPGSDCLNAVANCKRADGANLNPRGFWGTLLTQGAENINGDAYQPYYDNRTSPVSPACSSSSAANRACYDPISYYNYAIEMPPNSTGGSVYIYDPVFCEVENDKGTGDRWFGGTDPVSTFYEVYNTRNTLYEETDDILLATSGNLFRNIEGSDTTMGGTTSSGADECRYETDDTYGDGRDYHNRWWLLYSGLTGGPTGTIYRVHTTSTDPSSATAQRNTNGENSFAIYASAAGGTPRVYGLGAMQAYTPLKASSSGGPQASEFYLAQLEAVHKGKTVEIRLWDPGDTTPLTASIQILIPTSSGWTATPVTYSAVLGTNNSDRADGGFGKPNCTTNSRTTPSSAGIVTWQSGGSSTGRFNGCWLTILAQIPSNYNAEQEGWWKIRYTMTGTGTSNDVTTWQVSIRGNPVHLVTP